MQSKIKRVMSIVFEIPVDEINDESSIETTKAWDSLRHMNLIVALEEEFNIQFLDEEILEVMKFQDIVNLVQKKLKN